MGFVSVDWPLGLGLAIAVSLDLVVRFFAFGIFESVALDIAFFSTTYSLTEFARFFFARVPPGLSADAQNKLAASNTEHGHFWLSRGVVGFFCLVALLVIHSLLRADLDKKTDMLVVSIANKVTGQRKAQIEAGGKIIHRSVLVTFAAKSGLIRQGKRDWRGEALAFLQSFKVSNVTLSDDSFLLSKVQRTAMAVAFVMFGTVSFMAPIVGF